MMTKNREVRAANAVEPVQPGDNIPPFILLILNAMTTQLNGTVDLNESSINTDCGHMKISLAGEHTVYVDGLYIDKDKQGQGCGSMMLSTLEKVLSKIAMQTMDIRLWPVKSAIGFYLKNDYKLYVETNDQEEYYMKKKKVYGRGWKQYEAKTRMSIESKVTDGLWTHEILYPYFEKSGLMGDNPLFYSFYISDLTNGDYRYAIKTIHPTRGLKMSISV